MDTKKLEYAANYYAQNRQLITGLDWEDELPTDTFKTDFIEGVKWHQKEIQRQSENIMNFLDKEKELMLSEKYTIDRIKWYFETYFSIFKKQDELYKPTEDNYGTPPQGDDKIEFRTSLKSKEYFSGSKEK
jgi:hypothetical protein